MRLFLQTLFKILLAADVFKRLGYYRIYKIGREDSVRAALEDFQSAEYYYFYQLKQQCNGAENSLLAAKEGQRIANQKLMEIVQGGSE